MKNRPLTFHPACIFPVVARCCRHVVRTILILDADDSVWDGEQIHALEDTIDCRFATQWELPKAAFLSVRRGDIQTRHPWYDLSYAPLIPASLGHTTQTHSISEMTRMIGCWLECVETRQREIRVYPGVDTTLTRIRERWGNRPDGVLEIWMHTNSPTHIALLRAKAAGILHHFDAIMGLAPNCPPEVAHGPYAACAPQIQDWIAHRYHSLPHERTRMILELGHLKAKPSTGGPHFGLGHTHFDNQVDIIGVDDRWSMGGRVTWDLRTRQSSPEDDPYFRGGHYVYHRSHFVHARIGAHEPVTGTSLPIPIHRAIHAFAELEGVMEELLG